MGEKNCPAVRNKRKMVDPTCDFFRSNVMAADGRGVRDGGFGERMRWGEELDACMLLSLVANTVELSVGMMSFWVSRGRSNMRMDTGGSNGEQFIGGGEMFHCWPGASYRSMETVKGRSE